MPKRGERRVRKEGKKITRRTFFTKAILAINYNIRRNELLTRNFRKNGVEEMGQYLKGWRGPPFSTHAK